MKCILSNEFALRRMAKHGYGDTIRCKKRQNETNWLQRLSCIDPRHSREGARQLPQSMRTAVFIAMAMVRPAQLD